jgi:hypothetical protein
MPAIIADPVFFFGFETVTNRTALVAPTFTLPKLIPAGVSFSAPIGVGVAVGVAVRVGVVVGVAVSVAVGVIAGNAVWTAFHRQLPIELDIQLSIGSENIFLIAFSSRRAGLSLITNAHIEPADDGAHEV